VRLILASASPRRAELLRAAGYSFETLTVDVDEETRNGEAPADYVRRLAMEKSAQADLKLCSTPVAEMAQALRRAKEVDIVILAADTAVVVDGEILGKPRDDRDAERMLRLLSGRSHEVKTGVSLRRNGREGGGVISSAVWFNPLTDADIVWYVASGEGRDKAGAYAIQGLASRFIPRIEGSYANVVGLPVAAVAQMLEQLSSGGQTGV
jgi:septum formation protein